ncbi:MAG: hypothetical protein AABZ31_06495 [Bdellovibrionota bacterium]
MSLFIPLRELPKSPQYKKGDVMVMFGELFTRGYANGIVEEAERIGMKVIYSTVGRRDAEMNLRPLTAEELAEKAQPLINIPLEAGFDLEPDSKGRRPVDQLKEYGLTGWEAAELDWDSLNDSRKRGTERFQKATQAFLKEVQKLIPAGANVLFVHTMAGGFPRAKVVMPIANRVFKGSGARFLSSETFWKSQIGKLCDVSFNEVTAETLRHLIQQSEGLRHEVKNGGGQVSYVAYGYHGNEALIGGDYKWYSYSPYLQGWAKIKMEEVAAEAFSKGIPAHVMNVPEILTNSSSIFLGVEISLYTLIRAIKKENRDPKKTQELIDECQALLKDGFTFDDVDAATQEYLTNPKVLNYPSFKNWPQHNAPEQMELMRQASQKILDMHKDQKHLLTAHLSEIVFKATGKVMLAESYKPRAPIQWMGHDLVAKLF